MRHDDLPLFAWRPPCRVVVFPMIHRVGKVRRTARILAGKHGDDAHLYWKQVVSSLRKQLHRIDLSDAEVERQVQSFFDAVQAEMNRMGPYSQKPGDRR